MICLMIDQSFLPGSFSRITGESPFADFYADGQLRTFRATAAYTPGLSVTLKLEHDRPQGSLERLEIYSGSPEEFEDWVRHAIQSITDLSSGVRRCVFCEKTEAEVAVLIAGPTSYLCDECIQTCGQILEERQA